MTSLHSHSRIWLALGLVVSLIVTTFISVVPAGSAPADETPGHTLIQGATPPEPAPRFDWPWAEGFYQAGTNGAINAVILGSNGDLYVGGQFSTIGDVIANNVARWDGTSWHALGDGTNNIVHALAISPNGTLYAGGSFTKAGECTTNCARIAAWNGTDWSALDTGIDSVPAGGVRALAVTSDGTLYAGGDFAAAGSCVVDCTNIARWNGTTWSALEKGTGGRVLALALDSTGNLYVGGAFSSIDSTGCVPICTNIGMWNGTTWSSLESGLLGNTVYTLAVDSSNRVYAGGDFIIAGTCNIDCAQIARWNGTSWSSIGYTGFPTSMITELAIQANGTLYAFGGPIPTATTFFGSYNGTSWSDLTPSSPSGLVQALAIDESGKLYVGGQFQAAGDCLTACKSIAQLSGNVWSPLGRHGRGPDGDSFALATAPNGDIYVGGMFNQAGTCTTGCRNIARWDGTNWHALGNGLNHDVAALAFDDNGILYAGGTGAVSKWDGTTWGLLGNPGDIIGFVQAIAIDHNGAVYIAGSFPTIVGCPDCRSIAKWNGTAWAPLDMGITAQVFALAVDSNNTLYVGGTFTNIPGATTTCPGCQYIATWSTTGWTPLASTPSNRVRAILIDSDNKLYVGGDFTSAGTCITNCKRIAAWNGTSWSGIGTGTNGPVNSLMLDAEGVLYAGGNFTAAGTCDEECNFIAGWDGTTWFSLSEGMDGPVNGLAVNRTGAVHAVGFFGRAGDTVSRSFAMQSINRVALPLTIR